jgi:hypothetical protein
LLTDRDEMSNLYRGPSIDDSYYVLKLLGQMNRNFAESMYGRSSIEIANFVLIRIQTWQFLFLIGRFLKSISSEITRPNEPKLEEKKIF